MTRSRSVACVRNWLDRQTAIESIEEFLSARATGELTLDVGAQDSRYSSLFPKTIAVDALELAEIDVNADAHCLPIRDRSFAFVLSTEMLEHCVDPRTVIGEFYRVLRPGGRLVLTTRFLFPVHDAPGDFHRFTPEQMRVLLRDFADVEVRPAESVGRAMAVIAERLSRQVEWRVPGFRWLLRAIARALPLLDAIAVTEYGDARRTVPLDGAFTTGLLVTARKGVDA